MLTSFFIVVAAALLATALLGWAAYSRRFTWAALGAVVGITLVLTITCLFWQQVVLITAISSVVFLGIGVMLQKVEPAKAITGAVAAMVLFFAFSWLAVQLADTFLFGRESDVEKWLTREWHFLPVDNYLSWPDETVQAALGFACLAASAFLKRILRAVLVFAGILLLAIQLVHFFKGRTWATQYPLFHDPLLQCFFILVLAVFVIRILAQSLYADEPDKNRTSVDRLGEKHQERGP